MIRPATVMSVLSAGLMATLPMIAVPGGSWNFDAAPVGTVTVNRSFECGGTLVGADIVMTAAHCVIPKGTDDPVNPESVTFSLRSESGSREVFAVENIATPGGFFHPRTPTRDVIERDVALLRLDRFAGRGADSVAAPDRNVDHVALLPESPLDPFEGEPCAVDFDDAILILSCSRARGASGSPVYGLVDGERRIVGVISSDGSRSGDPVVFAVSPVSVMRDLDWLSPER